MRFIIRAAGVLLIGASGLAVAASEKVIEEVGSRFPLANLEVARGDSVVFVNGDDVVHNITVVDDDDNAVDLGMQRSQQRISHLFDKSGRFSVRCSVHPRMKMNVNVR
jgi:plastocyanin